MEHITTCPICNGQDFRPFLICKDYTVSRESFNLLSCITCEFVLTSPRPNENEIGRYYESSDYVSHSDTNSGIINRIYQWVKNFTIKGKVGLVESVTKERTILDIGCGTGSFVGSCKSSGWNVMGVEPNNKAIENCFKNFGFRPKNSFNHNDYEEGSLGVITMWHVLEHVHSLDYYLSTFHKIIKENGVLIIAVPNLKSYDAKFYKENWAAYDVPRHLWHFSPKTIVSLCSNYGFDIKEIRPMWFDSFYVSMLSEKNKNGGNVPLAFCVGLVSNLKSLFKKGTCSSQIYIFVKRT